MKNLLKLKLPRDLFALSGGLFLGKIIGFIAFAYLARTLDPSSYGAVEYAVSLAVVFAMVVDWGLGPIGVREISDSRRNVSDTAALIPTARLGIALIVIPVMGFSTLLTGQTGEFAELIWLFALGLFMIPWKQDWLLQGREMMAAAAGAEVVRMTAFALGVVFFVHASSDLLRVGMVEIAAVGLVAAYYLLIQQNRITPVRLKFSPPALARLMRQGFSVGFTNMIWATTQYAPMFFVANMVGGAETAWFGASHRIVISLLAFSWVYHFNLYPSIVRRVGEGPEELDRLMRASFRVVAWCAILLALVITLLAEPLLTLVYGDKFATAAPAFAVLIWALPATFLSGHARWVLVAAGQQRYLLFATICGAVAVVAFGAVLVPPFHATGAAIAMLAASLVVWIAAHFFALARVGRVPRLSVAGWPIVFAVLGGGLARAVDAAPWPAAAAVAAAYVICAPLIDRKLLSDLRHLLRAKTDFTPDA